MTGGWIGMETKMNPTPDLIGGIIYLVGAAFFCLNIRRTYLDKEIKGVNPAVVIFFALVNVYYGWFFYINDHPWSLVGSIALGATQLYWWGQMIYYNRRNRKNEK